MGERWGYGAGHKRDRWLVEELGALVEGVPVCPEVEVGMGVPRPTLGLVCEAEGVRLRESVSGRDHTRRMQAYAKRRVRALRQLDLGGYVLKKGSPSCGVEGVPLYETGRRGGASSRSGQGLFAAALFEAFPELPIEEEGRLEEARLRENFIERLFAYRRAWPSQPVSSNQA